MADAAPERLQGLFDGLAATLAMAQEADEAQETEHLAGLAHFFAGLVPAVTVAMEAQKVLDRVAATNFSVFRYFKENENLVSGIFADLLRPDGSHGQGTVFLRLFLKEIDRGRKTRIRKWDAYGSLERCSVYTEYSTDERRRVDIVIKLGDMWIGVENKPWAGEQPDQLQHYLQFLQQERRPSVRALLERNGRRRRHH